MVVYWFFFKPLAFVLKNISLLMLGAGHILFQRQLLFKAYILLKTSLEANNIVI